MIKISSLLRHTESSLRKKIKKYRTAAGEIKKYLDKHPGEWGRFQSDFNQEINKIFRGIMDFEKECLEKGDEASVYKLKRIFTNRLRKDFLHGEYIRWSLEKPYGYPGDFKIIDEIYKNNPSSDGFDRLYDNYYQSSSISIAVRNRKEDFKRIILTIAEAVQNQPIKIMDLACGPCRELKELMAMVSFSSKRVQIDCLDQDQRALDYAKSLLLGYTSIVTFVRENVLRIALMKNIELNIQDRYDLIYSTGLFDYLDQRAAVRLVANLKKILKAKGMLVISDVRDKYQNPSVHFMEWVGDWNLVYRSDDEFIRIFFDSGFKEKDLQTSSEQQGIMQYMIASNQC